MKNSDVFTDRISILIARKVMLASQGLDRLPGRPATKANLLEVIRRMDALQIDTIHVIRRSPYRVLWSRLGDYRPEWLDELLTEGALFEYWSHAMCWLPIEDYPLYRRRMLDAIKDKGWPIKWAVDWSRDNPEIIERVRTHLRENGAVRSAEFVNKNRPPGGWWNWKEEKNALEALLYRSNPEFFYREAPINGVMYLDEDQFLLGVSRIKRPRRIAEKANRYVANWIFQVVQKRAQEMAERRAREYAVPLERLITPRDVMEREFVAAEKAIARQFREGTIRLDREAVTIHDVGGVKIVAGVERLAHLERTVAGYARVSVVEKTIFSGNYQAASVIVEAPWDAEHVCRRLPNAHP